MPYKPALTVITSGYANENADTHAVIIRLTAQVLRRIQKLRLEIVRRNILKIVLPVDTEVVESDLSSTNTCLSGAIETTAWLKAYGDAPVVSSRNTELVVDSFGMWWVRYTVKHLEDTIWSTPAMTVADLAKWADPSAKPGPRQAA